MIRSLFCIRFAVKSVELNTQKQSQMHEHSLQIDRIRKKYLYIEAMHFALVLFEWIFLSVQLFLACSLWT